MGTKWASTHTLLRRYFHCDPHPGNLCVDASGNLVYYDYGMMDELKPNVKAGFKQSPLLVQSSTQTKKLSRSCMRYPANLPSGC